MQDLAEPAQQINTTHDKKAMSEYAWNHPPSARRIGPVGIPERRFHHPLLTPDPKPEQGAEADKASGTGDPVGQQQGLRNRPQEERRIHRMAHMAIDAVGDEL